MNPIPSISFTCLLSCQYYNCRLCSLPTNRSEEVMITMIAIIHSRQSHSLPICSLLVPIWFHFPIYNLWCHLLFTSLLTVHIFYGMFSAQHDSLYLQEHPTLYMIRRLNLGCHVWTKQEWTHVLNQANRNLSWKVDIGTNIVLLYWTYNM